MRSAKALWIVVVLSTLSCVLGASPAHASTPVYRSITRLRHDLIGQAINYTDRSGVTYNARITGWHSYTEHKYGTMWLANTAVNEVCYSPHGCGGPQAMARDGSAWNPIYWQWQGIFATVGHWFWNHVGSHCVSGADAGGMTSISTAIATRIAIKGESLTEVISKLTGPEGMAVAMIGTCLFDVYQNATGQTG